MSEMIDNAMSSMRNIITQMRPAILDDLGLIAAIEWQCAQFSKRTGIDCQITRSEDRDRKTELVSQYSINLFRIFQESLTNIERHSGASRVEVKFIHDEDKVTLSISDNGCGLPNGHTIPSSSYGIRGMHERMENLGGDIQFDSASGNGLTVTATIKFTPRS